MKKECQYCQKEITFKKQQQFSAHSNHCKHDRIKKKIKLKCLKCNKIYWLKLNKFDIKKGTYRKHYSRKCANGRIHSINTKNKISKSVKKHNKNYLLIKRIKKLCYTCKKEFSVIPSSKKQTCGKKKCLSNLRSDNSKRNKCGGHTSKQSIYYKCKDGNIVYLQSNYEVLVAKDLDKNNIKWLRPKPFNWIDKNNEEHRYYPDFYLSEYNVYLDPKNDYLIKIDKDKINRVRKQNNINLIILDKNNLSWNNLKKLIKWKKKHVRIAKAN